MKIALCGLGTRGDMQPFVCAGRALADRGHDVEVIVPRNGEGMVRAAGLQFHALPYDVQAMLHTVPAQRMLAAGRVTAFLRWFYEEQNAHAVSDHAKLSLRDHRKV